MGGITQDVVDPHLNVAPIVVEVWETSIKVKIQRFANGSTFATYHLWVDGPEYRLDRYLTQTDVVITITELSPDTGYTIRIRGQVTDKDVWTGFSQISCSTMPTLQIHAGRVAEEHVELKMDHGKMERYLMAPIEKYEVLLTSKEFVLSAVSFHEMVDASEVKGGTLRIPYLKCNRAFMAKCRPQEKGGTWGQWSEEIRVLTLKEAYINIQEVGEDFVAVQWYRPRMQNMNRDPNFHIETDMLISKFRLRVWEACIRENGSKILPCGKRVPWYNFEMIQAEEEACSKNMAKAVGLRPSRTYLIRADVKNTVGDWSVPLYFRFNTLPTVNIHRVISIGTDFVELSWIRQALELEERDVALDQWDDGSDPSYRGHIRLRSPIQWIDQRTYIHATPEKFGIRCYNIITNLHKIIPAQTEDRLCRIDVLQPATTYAIAIRSKVHGEWTPWSQSILVTTPEQLTVKVQKRSKHYLHVNWGRSKPVPVFYLDDGPFADEQSEVACDEARQKVMVPHYHTKSCRVLETLPIDESLVNQGLKQVCIQLTVMLDKTTEDKSRGHPVVLEKKFSLVTGSFLFDHLTSDSLYRVVIRLQSADDSWKDGNSLLAETLHSSIETLDDEDNKSDGVEDELESEEGIEDLLGHAESAAKLTDDTSRVEVSTLEVRVGEVGESYVSISWLKLDEALQAFGIQSAKVPPQVQTEYKVELTILPEEEENRPYLSESQKIDIVKARDTEIETLQPQTRYFRTSVPQTRLSNVLPDTLYSLRMTSFDNTHQEWSAYSKPIRFATARQIDLYMQDIHQDSLVLKWRRFVHSDAPDQSSAKVPVVQTIPTIVRTYQLKLVEINTLKASYISIDGPGSSSAPTSYSLTHLQLNGLYGVWVRPAYSPKVWGAYSEPIFFTFSAIKFRVVSVGQESLFLKWTKRPVHGLKRGQHRGCDDKIVISLVQVGTGRIQNVELPTHVSSYRFLKLEPNTQYTVSIVAVEQVHCPVSQDKLIMDEDDTPPSKRLKHTGTAVLPSTNRPKETYARTFTTLNPMNAWINSAGEDYVILSWPQKESCPYEDPDFDANESKPEAGQALLDWKIQAELAKQRTENPSVPYEVKVTEKETSLNCVVVVHPRLDHEHETISKRIGGLRPNQQYTVSIRPGLTCGSFGQWSAEQEFMTLDWIVLEIDTVGEDFVMATWDRPPVKCIIPKRGGPCTIAEQEPVYKVQIREIIQAKNPKFQKAARKVPFGLEDMTISSHHTAKPDNVALDIPDDIDDEQPEIFNKQFQAKEKQAFITGLKPDKPYSITVRQLSFEQTWGQWSKATAFRTPSSITIDLLRNGEDYIDIVFQRSLPSGSAASRASKILSSPMFAWEPPIIVPTETPEWLQKHARIHQYQVLAVDQSTGEVAYEKTLPLLGSGENPEEHRLCPLVSNQDFDIKVKLHYCEDHWGMWSRSKILHTMPGVDVRIEDVGEDFIDIHWMRIQPEESADATEDKRSVVTLWQVHLKSAADCVATIDGDVIIEQDVKPEELSLFCRRLLPDTLYRIQVRSCDDAGCWSPWSTPMYCSTLPLLKIELSNLAESFVLVNWNRPRFSFLENINIIPDKNMAVLTEMGTDVKYELCAFEVVKTDFDQEEEGFTRHQATNEIGSKDGWLVNHSYEGNVLKTRLDELEEGKQYGVSIRAAHRHKNSTKEESFGMWSQKYYFHTLPVVNAWSTAVGQDYINLKWRCVPPQRWAHDVEIHMAPISHFQVMTKKVSPEPEEVTVEVVPYEGEQMDYSFSIHTLNSLTVYHIYIQRVYAECVQNEMEALKGEHVISTGKPLCITTVPPVVATILSIGETSARFLCGIPIDAQNFHHSARGDLKGWAKPFRSYDVRIGQKAHPQALEIDIAAYSQAELAFDNLERDTEYEIFVKERGKDLGAGWCHLLKFNTVPYPPVPGELQECRGGQIVFTWGVTLGSDPSKVLTGDAVPGDFIFCIEFKIKNNMPGLFEASEEDGVSQHWQVAGIHDKPQIRMHIEHSISNYVFRVKAAQHYITARDGQHAPLWGPYSASICWKDPPVPLNVGNLRIVNLKANSATVMFERPLNANLQAGLQYEVTLGTNDAAGQRQWSHLITSAAREIDVSQLESNTTYRAAVRALSNFGKSKKSSMVAFTTHTAVTKGLVLKGRRGPVAMPIGEELEPRIIGIRPQLGEDRPRVVSNLYDKYTALDTIMKREDKSGTKTSIGRPSTAPNPVGSVVKWGSGHCKDFRPATALGSTQNSIKSKNSTLTAAKSGKRTPKAAKAAKATSQEATDTAKAAPSTLPKTVSAPGPSLVSKQTDESPPQKSALPPPAPDHGLWGLMSDTLDASSMHAEDDKHETSTIPETVDYQSPEAAYPSYGAPFYNIEGAGLGKHPSQTWTKSGSGNQILASDRDHGENPLALKNLDMDWGDLSGYTSFPDLNSSRNSAVISPMGINKMGNSGVNSGSNSFLPSFPSESQMIARPGSLANKRHSGR